MDFELSRKFTVLKCGLSPLQLNEETSCIAFAKRHSNSMRPSRHKFITETTDVVIMSLMGK